MKLVILDQGTIAMKDLTWDGLEKLGDVIAYDESTPEEALERTKDAQAIFTSKVYVSPEIMDNAPGLKYIGTLATGFDNIDVDAARARGIACTNIPAYSTEAVAQHTIALILEASNHIGMYSRMVRDGQWAEAKDFCLVEEPLTYLPGKSLGIVGYGNIGKAVARIAEALGLEILVYSRDGDAALAADIVTLHMPANEETRRFINADTLDKMKDGAVLINTARGALIDEDALRDALDSGKISWYAADVLTQEPPEPGNALANHPRAIITPHNCWTPKEIRQRICERTAENFASFLEGGRLNRID